MDQYRKLIINNSTSCSCIIERQVNVDLLQEIELSRYLYMPIDFGLVFTARFIELRHK